MFGSAIQCKRTIKKRIISGEISMKKYGDHWIGRSMFFLAIHTQDPCGMGIERSLHLKQLYIFLIYCMIATKKIIRRKAFRQCIIGVFRAINWLKNWTILAIEFVINLQILIKNHTVKITYWNYWEKKTATTTTLAFSWIAGMFRFCSCYFFITFVTTNWFYFQKVPLFEMILGAAPWRLNWILA